MLLLSPGPGMSDYEVEQEISKPCIHHRSDKFKILYQEIIQDLKHLLGASQGEVIIMNGSGSYAMEGATLNLLKKEDVVLSIRCGYFSDRLCKMAMQRGCEMYSLIYNPYETCNLDDVTWMLEHYSITHLLVTYCESETGSLQDVRSLGELCHKHNILFIVDGISGAIMNEIEMDLMHIDCLIMASQKGFLMPPGLCINIISQKALEVMKQISSSSYVFDYKTILSKFYHDARIHSTPCIPLYCGLHLALQKLKQATSHELVLYYQQLHQFVKQELQNMKFQIMAEGHESNSIIVCKVPYGKHASHIQYALEKRGIRIELGLRDNQDQILRIGIMNAVSKKDYEKLIYHLKEIIYAT